jgi:4-amino-4-deoxy-L-arabinose transferase-like glycosyltransferase
LAQGPSKSRKRLAIVLWIVWAVVVWNLVFDRVLIDAGREYIVAAMVAARDAGPYARIDDFMRPALPRALALASAAAGVILAVGLVAFRRAARATSTEPPRRT